MISEAVLDVMAVKAAETLLMEGSVRGIDRAGLVSLLRRSFAEEMDVENKLYAEAEKLLAANLAALKGSKADPGEMRRKIMQKLAAERGLVLR